MEGRLEGDVRREPIIVSSVRSPDLTSLVSSNLEGDILGWSDIRHPASSCHHGHNCHLLVNSQ